MLATLCLFLAAAVLFVPLFKRLGLGAVLGYLIAGVAIGPGGLGLVGDVEAVMHVSELGVVMLLFVIGLELQPSRLWALRRAVFGSGGIQVTLSTALIAIAAMFLGQQPGTALLVGFGLAMSSTALVLQMLGERKELPDHHGRVAFAILLFQDLAVIPFLALVPLLAGAADPAQNHALHVLVAVAAFLGVVLGGRYALRPVLRMLAAADVPEIFTAASLLLVVGAALLMDSVGLSMSLGAFLAGVLLADSEYRHELQADIQPFKGLLLGLFFIAVGMGADLRLALDRPLDVLGLVAGLLLIKGLVLFGVAKLDGLRHESALRLALAASQGGEFAFVLFGVAAAGGLLPGELHALLIVAVSLSMMISPPLYALLSRFRRSPAIRPYDEINVAESPVVIAGFGPFGQIVGRVLRVRGIPFTVLERDWQQVDFVRQFGNPVFYSDATRLEVLRAAHVAKARVFLVTVADPEEVALQMVQLVRRHFPQVKVFAVARSRAHAMRLVDVGAHRVIRRTLYSSLRMTRDVLMEFGDSADKADDMLARFQQFDEESLRRQQAIHRDPARLLQSAHEAARELELLFESDREAERKAQRQAAPEGRRGAAEAAAAKPAAAPAPAASDGVSPTAS